jgi:outer membrane protein TolC
MMKQVRFKLISKTAAGMTLSLLCSHLWPPTGTAQAQVRPALTFELPAVCTADLDEGVPAPGSAPDVPPESVVIPENNPLLVPTRPDQVEITEQQPLSLEQAIELAYRNNPELATARLAVERSQAALNEALASRSPTVDLNARVDVLTNPSQGQDLDEDANISTVAALTGNATATYDVLTGGERRARIEAAQLQVQQQQLALEQAQAALRSQTSLAYYDVQGARERIRISQDFLAESCRNLRDSILFFEAGVGTRLDVLRADVQVAQARQDLVLSRNSWKTAQRQLAARLNLPPDTTVATTNVRIDGFWPLTLEESIVLAFQNRAELEENLLQRDIADAQQQVALSSIRPRLQATGSVNAALALTDIASANLPGFDRNSSAGFGLRLGGRWRVFDGGAANARAQQSDQDRAIADFNFSQDRNQIRLEVEEAYFNLEANLANIDTARTALEQAREALRLAQRRFDAGVGDQLDVLTAQRELTEAQVRLLEAVLGYNRSLTALERAVTNLAQ